jgi:hypothetical protein
MPSGKFLLGDARVVCEGDMNLLRVGPKYSVNIPSGIVTKPPKPGFVGFGITYLGDYQEFLDGLFLGFTGGGGLYRGGIFLRSALATAVGLHGGNRAIKYLWWTWGRGGQRPVFSAYRAFVGGV